MALPGIDVMKCGHLDNQPAGRPYITDYIQRHGCYVCIKNEAANIKLTSNQMRLKWEGELE